MPTGYTSDVVNGKVTTLREFALQCARGMGATIMMRDDPWDKPIPEAFEPSGYHLERQSEAEARLAEIDGLTPAEANEKAAQAFAEDHSRWLLRGKENEEQRERYQAMIAKVQPWHGAPDGLKTFMLDQLQRGMGFDCSPDGREKYDPEPVNKSGAEWRRDEAKKALRDIAYHREQYAKELSHTEDRNRWILQLHRALRDSDEHRDGEDPQGLSGEAMPARADPASPEMVHP